jgi:hypothetical protein
MGLSQLEYPHEELPTEPTLGSILSLLSPVPNLVRHFFNSPSIIYVNVSQVSIFLQDF